MDEVGLLGRLRPIGQGLPFVPAIRRHQDAAARGERLPGPGAGEDFVQPGVGHEVLRIVRSPASVQALQFEVAGQAMHCHGARAWRDVVERAGRVAEQGSRIWEYALDVIERAGLLDDSAAHAWLLAALLGGQSGKAAVGGVISG